MFHEKVTWNNRVPRRNDPSEPAVTDATFAAVLKKFVEEIKAADLTTRQKGLGMRSFDDSIRGELRTENELDPSRGLYDTSCPWKSNELQKQLAAAADKAGEAAARGEANQVHIRNIFIRAGEAAGLVAKYASMNASLDR